jgi:hypothetical protein
MVSSFHFSLPSIQAKHLTLTTAWHLTSRGVWWWYKMWSPSRGRSLLYNLNFKLQINHWSHISSYWPKQTQNILAVAKPKVYTCLTQLHQKNEDPNLVQDANFSASQWLKCSAKLFILNSCGVLDFLKCQILCVIEKHQHNRLHKSTTSATGNVVFRGSCHSSPSIL